MQRIKSVLRYLRFILNSNISYSSSILDSIRDLFTSIPLCQYIPAKPKKDLPSHCRGEMLGCKASEVGIGRVLPSRG